jgi:hypothetical protein
MTGIKTPTPQGIRYHYVITFQFEASNGIQRLSYEHGVIVPGPGQSRGDLFRRIFQGAAATGGRNPVPLFFLLEPDDLAAPSAPPTPEEQRQ